MIIDKLQEFRQQVYRFLGNGRDAIFDLMDAVLTSPSVKSFAELSLSAVYRRKWSSLYESLKDSRPRRGRLRRLCVEQIPKDIRPLLAGDHTGWGRPHAKTLKERSFVHQPNLVEGNKPIVLGHDYSTLGWVPEKSGSWAIPLCHERISSFETAAQRGAFQLRQVCRDLSVRPIATYDSEYGSAAFINLTEDIPADLLLRLRPNRCLYKAPEPYSGYGRPRKHGDKFQLANAASWGEAQSTFTIEDETVGQVLIQQWSNLHFKKAAQRHFQVIRVTHPHCSGLWLAWVGENMPTLPQLWRLYLRRFAIDHWNRFAKQRLHWTLPHLLTPQQALRWSDLMPLLSWQLWLARQLVIDSPLPWQKPQTNLSLGRVAQGFATRPRERLALLLVLLNRAVSLLAGNLDANELLFLAFPSSKNALLVQKRSTKISLIPNPRYSPFHSLGFAQLSILWVTFSCSFFDFLNQLSLDSRLQAKHGFSWDLPSSERLLKPSLALAIATSK